MNVTNRDVLIDYILGRLNQSESETVEEQARVDSDLAQTLEILRREISDVGIFANSHEFPRPLKRPLHDSSASRIRDARSETKSETKDDDSSRDKNAQTENRDVERDSSSIEEARETMCEESGVSSFEKSETDSWNSLFSEAFASFAEENEKAQERADAISRKRAAKKAEIKPAVVVPHPTNERLRQLEDANLSNSEFDRDQTNETRNGLEQKSDKPVSLYDVEVRTASQPIRRRKRFEFIPKSVQAPASADASGFTFKRPVAFSLDEQGKKRRKSERFLEASAPVLGERVAFIRASLDFVDSIPDFSSSLNVRTRILRSKVAFNAVGTFVDDSFALCLHGWRDSVGLSTCATVETFAAVDERLLVSTESERGNFALCRGTISEDLFDVDVLTPCVETALWTVDSLDAPEAYLVASLPYAQPTSDADLERRVEPSTLESAPSTSLMENTTEREVESSEYAFQEIEEVSSASEAEPYPVTELLEESTRIDDLSAVDAAAETFVPDVLSATEQTEESVLEPSEILSESEQVESTFVAETSGAFDLDVPGSELAQESAPAEILPESEQVESTFVAETSGTFDLDVPVSELAQESAPAEILSEPEQVEPTFVAETSGAFDLDVPVSELAQELAPAEILSDSEQVESTFVAETSGVSELDVQNSGFAQELPTLEPTCEETEETLLENALIVPQQTDSYYASDDTSAEDAEEYGPTLSAEDRRLAELLGHTPTPLELDEFYWEDLEDVPKSKRRSSESNAVWQLLGGVIYIATAPVVLVGRATLGIGGLFLPRRYEQTALKESGSRKNKKQRKSEEFFDVAVPCIAGILIAIFVVFPFLLRSIDYAARSIGGDVFRRISGKVTVPSALEGQINTAWSAKMLESQLEMNGENASIQEEQTDANGLQLPAE